MLNYDQFYINGQWVDPADGGELFDVINPATEEISGTVRLGNESDVDRAVAAAQSAFAGYSQTSLQMRLDLLGSIINEYEKRLDDFAEAVSLEMGAPLEKLAKGMHAPGGLGHFRTTQQMAAVYPFEEQKGSTLLVKEARGVCALITPWNWPINQIACKLAPALVTGCTVVLKPSELAPYSAMILAEVLHAAGVPAGVFNMIMGDGATVGPGLSSHPGVDMVSLTGSTRSGVSVARNAADSIKVVSLELGGKSANIILDDAPLSEAVTTGVRLMMNNCGQSCNAPSRMLVPAAKMEEAEQIAAGVVEGLVVGDPRSPETMVGPLANRRQFERVQTLIEKGISQGAKVVIGGPGRPEGLTRGYFAKPTVFSSPNNSLCIAREEIFGPVLTMIPYSSEEEAVSIANDTDYGLSGYVYGATIDRARAVARRLRTGQVHLNGAPIDRSAPFGGYKQSGLGREWGTAGIDEFVESKAILGSQSS